MYSTDLTKPQWEFIKKVLDPKDRKRKYNLRIIWNAIVYLLKTGCQWRMLPSNFPKWQIVYYYYDKWSRLEYFDLLMSKTREKVRSKRGQKPEPSLGIIDSQSVRQGNNRAPNSFDGNKKVKGIKRHIVVDKNGFLLVVAVTLAGIHDSKAAILLMYMLHYLFCPVKVILADAAYRGGFVDFARREFGYLIRIITRPRSKKKEFKPLENRWVVERTFSWLDNDRRLCRNYEVLNRTSENMVKLSAIKLLLNKI